MGWRLPAPRAAREGPANRCADGRENRRGQSIRTSPVARRSLAGRSMPGQIRRAVLVRGGAVPWEESPEADRARVSVRKEKHFHPVARRRPGQRKSPSSRHSSFHDARTRVAAFGGGATGVARLGATFPPSSPPFCWWPCTLQGNVDAHATMRADSTPPRLELFDIQLVPIGAVEPDAHRSTSSR